MADCDKCPDPGRKHTAFFRIMLSGITGTVFESIAVCPCCLFNEFREVGLAQIEGGEDALLKMAYKECHGIVS